MNINLTEISIDTIIQAISIIGATLTFVFAQSIEKKKDRKQANKESYQQLEFASIDLFRFEAENIELIRPIWEEDREIPSKNTAEYIVLMNYVCQMLNLFEMATKFRKDKTLLPEVFGTWIAWFQLLVMSPGFHEIWKDVRMDYLPELREIMDGGILIAKQETDEDLCKSNFYQFVSSVIKCDTISEWIDNKKEQDKESFRNKIFRKQINKKNKIDLEQLSFKWIHDLSETEKLTTLFISNSKEDYISHGEIQEGRAYNENTWSNDILTILTSEFNDALKNELFHHSNIVAAYLSNNLVGFALVEYKNSPNGSYAVLSDIIVDKNYRNNNIGEKLIKWVLIQLNNNNIKSLFAESNINNHVAHQFLIKLGFKPISKVFKQNI